MHRWGIALAALVAMATASSAQAVVMRAVYTGEVRYMYDNHNLFGRGTYFEDSTFRAVFRYDTEVGDIYIVDPLLEIRGNRVDNPEKTVDLAVLIIGGVTINIPTLQGSAWTIDARRNTPGTFSNIAHEASNGSSNLFQLSFGARTIGAPARLSVPFAGELFEEDQDYGDGVFDYRLSPTDFSFGGLNARYATVSVAPEPSSWALLIGGFGFAGSMIRRRRSVAA